MPRFDGGPAFPYTPTYTHPNAGTEWTSHENNGMSLRDWFAGQAPEPPAWWYSSRQKSHPKESGLERDAAFRYAWADEMLKARESDGA